MLPVLPEPTARLRFRPMAMADLDDAARWIGDCGLTVQDVDATPHVEVGYHVVPDLRRLGMRLPNS